MKTVLITGTNRGLGLEFVRQFAAAGHRVIGTCRDPQAPGPLQEVRTAHSDTVHCLAFEAADPQAAPRLAAELEDFAPRLDLLINNAGVFPRNDFASASAGDLLTAYQVNCVAPFLLSRSLAPRLARGSDPLIVNISSLLGAVLPALELDGWPEYAYGASKAALNRLTRQLSKDLRPQGITVVAQYPGWVRTDMGGAQATLSVTESVSAMRRVFDRLGPSDSGRILDLDGSDATI